MTSGENQTVADPPSETEPRRFHERIAQAPMLPPGATVDLSDLVADPALAKLIEKPAVAKLLAGVAHGSPYLTSLMRRDPTRLARLLEAVPEELANTLATALHAELSAAPSIPDAMRPLRLYKTEIALLTALADLAGIWPVMTVTRVLSEAADTALTAVIRLLFREATARGDWQAEDVEAPEAGSGFMVLAVGKYGAFELNYSSDIDLIVFYDADLARVRDGLEISSFYIRLTRDLVRLMSERTADGYVFRIDLRLRPDAGATQIALSTEAAAAYYESYGQNWERAALIKARIVAGDLRAGDAFLEEVRPFIWRRHLDYAALADIHAMKRQIHVFRGFGDVRVAGQNIKLGPGGIREIEFFVQTQQLIAGGRHRNLRARRTLDALAALVALGWISNTTADELSEAYVFLRRLEHRIQMVDDEQTHELPDDPERLVRLALFAGFAGLEGFSQTLVATLRTVEAHYARLFEVAPSQSLKKTNLIFAGERDDPATMEALSGLGFERPKDVLAMVRGWHHGRYRAVRSPRARELLTEVQPALLDAFAGTLEPTRTMASFDRFLAELPTGIQLFSLLKANPALLRLLADIMGTAPRMASALSRRPRLLDAVIDPRTFSTLASEEELETHIGAEFSAASDLQDMLDRARIYGSEQAFLIGIRVLSGTIDASEAGAAYARLAECLIRALAEAVEKDLIRQHGRIQGGGAAVVAMGKLGGDEMTAASDVDLIVVYDFDPECTQSSGERSLAATQFYARLTQRLINALAAPTAEGTLYEVDMRLRPSGQKGPVAAQLSTFVDYQTTEAWTWEHLALTRARVISGPAELQDKVRAAIRQTLVRPRDRAAIASDVRKMRELIEAEKGTTNVWELKQVRGGLVDLEFMAQFLELVHADDHPELLSQTTEVVFARLAELGLLPAADAAVLIGATRLVHSLTQVLRLCLDGPFEPNDASTSLKALLARAVDAPSFERLEIELLSTLREVRVLFDEIIA